MTTDLDHLYALADGALGLAFHWHTKTALEYDHVLEPEDAAYIAAASPDVVKGLVERVRRAEADADAWKADAAVTHLKLQEVLQGITDAPPSATARTALEAKDE